MKIPASEFIILLLSVACNSDMQDKIPKDNARILPSQTIAVPLDTTIEYNLEGISAEGATASTQYINGNIKKCIINIYGETGQAEVHYVFVDSQINVSEKQFSYKTDFSSVKSNRDMILKKEITYVMDMRGNVIGNSGKGRIDILTEFMKIVPLEIR
jgi:hypothetical protein